MSNPFSLKVGSIIHEMESNIDHRVIYENGDCFVTILMHSPKSKVIINEWYSEMIRNLLENREIVIHEPKHRQRSEVSVKLPNVSTETTSVCSELITYATFKVQAIYLKWMK